MEAVRLWEGDCLDALPTLKACSIDAVVTDPPYALVEPRSRISYSRRERTEEEKKLRSGGFMGKLWDHEVPGVPYWQAIKRVLKPGGYMLAFGGTRTWHRLACAIEDAGFEIRDTLMWLYGKGFPKGKGCLKPAWEPIILARRTGPNVLPLGIEECRIGYGAKTLEEVRREAGSPGRQGGPETRGVYNGGWADDSDEPISFHPHGRYPANLILDEEAGALLDEQTGTSRSSGGITPRNRSNNGLMPCTTDDMRLTGNRGGLGDTGGASRFFYCAKASKADRGKGNTHPTVKPLALMRWLVKLVCPPGGLVLDPFAGSGTTGLACIMERRMALLVENDPDSCAIINTRLR